MIDKDIVVLVKMPSGEDIVGQLIKGPDKAGNITVKDCIIFIPRQDNLGRVGLNPLPYPTLADKGTEITFKPVFICKPLDKVLEGYLEILSPIQKASQSPGGFELPTF